MNPIIDDLTATITNATTVEKSAEEFIKGVATKIQAGIDAGLANGATAEQLAPFTDLNKALNDESAALQAAMTANTAAAKRAGK